MIRTPLTRAIALQLALAIAFAGAALAQLPPEAVQLDKLKIPEKIKSVDLDPIKLTPSDPAGPTWEHGGVTYRGASADSKDEFMKDPDKHAKSFAEERWVKNFIAAMSTVWCPVTDEVTPGGLLQWEKEGIIWESCCAFCDESVKDEDFPKAYELLLARAKKSFELTGGKYVEGASSPLEGAVDPDAKPAPKEHDGGHDAAAPAEPAWLKGKDLKPTFNEGIGLIFENRCVECHRPGGEAPMSFMTPAEIKKWTKSMKKSVSSREMPPFAAEGDFANSRALTKKELDVFDAWATAGYPDGAGSFKIDARWMGEWPRIGAADATFKLPAFTVPAGQAEVIQEFTIDPGTIEDRWIVAAEVRLGNDMAIRHIDAGPIGAFHLGNWGETLPAGIGRKLKAGEKIVVRVHYAKEKSAEIPDAGSTIGVVFAKDPSSIKKGAIRDAMANTSLSIPAGAEKAEAKARFEFKEDGEILGFNPVLQARGKTVRYEVTPPGGKASTPLSIPRWALEYQYRYWLAKPIAAPKGTVVEMIATYDNSKLNARNPDASVEVKAGPGGELLEGWIEYASGVK